VLIIILYGNIRAAELNRCEHILYMLFGGTFSTLSGLEGRAPVVEVDQNEREKLLSGLTFEGCKVPREISETDGKPFAGRSRFSKIDIVRLLTISGAYSVASIVRTNSDRVSSGLAKFF